MSPANGPQFERLEDRLLLSVTPIPTGTFLETGGQAVMETENFTTNVAGTGAGASTVWTSTTADSGYSGAAAMQAVPNAKVSLGDSLAGARLDYQVYFNTPGMYYVWVRTVGATGSDDSINAGLDGTAATLGKWGMSETTGTWDWNNSTVDANGSYRVTINVATAGLHTFNIWMREDGTAVDKIVLTQNAVYAPSGAGPAESARAAANQSPVAVNDTATTEAGKPVSINVLANDSDGDGDVLSVASFGQGAHGSVTAGTDGALIYTPVAGYVGADTFGYTVSDGNGGTASASVAVNVTAAPGDGAFLASGGMVSIEAEDFTAKIAGTGAGANTTWTPTTALAGYSGAGALQALPNAKVSLGDSLSGSRLDYQIQFDAPGTYYVWVRTIGATGSDDSINVGLDGQAVTLGKWGMMDTTSTWDWNNSVKDAGGGYRVAINVTTAGVHTFNIWMREDGTAVDKIVLTRDATYTPTGTGPAESSRAGGATNADPVAVDDVVSATCGVPVTVNVLSNDSDPDGDLLTVTANTAAAHGTVVKNSNGTFTYTSAAGYVGADSFGYTISDGNGGTASAVVNLTVAAAPNNAPTAVNDTVTTAEDTPVTINVLANDTDLDGDALTVTANTQAAHGTLVKNSNGTFTYTPALNYSGSDSFNYTVSDGKGGTATGAVAITVTPVNDAPTAADDTVTTAEDTPVTINVLANDTDPDGDALTVTANTQAAHGTLVKNSNGMFTYTPALNYSGSDSFNYTVSDGKGGTATGAVAITVTPVNDAPTAANDTATTLEGEAVTVNVLANDTDVDGDALSVASFTQAAHGSVAAGSDGLVYTPVATYSGQDSFTYVVSDGKGGTSTAAVTLTITPVNTTGAFLESNGLVSMEAENATANVAGTGAGANTAWTPTTALTGFSGASAMQAVPNAKVSLGDSLAGARLDYQIQFSTPGTYYVWIRTIGATGSDDSINVGLDGQAVTLGKWGMTDTTTTWDWNNSVVDANGATRVAVNVATAGVHTLNVWMREDGTAVDKIVLTRDATYTPTGTGPAQSARTGVTANANPVAANDAVSAISGTPVTVNVLANDSDPDGDPLTVTANTAAAHGTVVKNSNGTFTYTSAAGYIGADSFGYSISDGKGGTASALVNVTVAAAANHAPVATDDAAIVGSGSSATINVLANDTDVDGDTLSISQYTQAAHGTLVKNSNGTFTYTPTASYYGSDGFGYTVSDGHGGTDTAAVTLTVTPPGGGTSIPGDDLGGSVMYIDRDGDGYGVASSKGPDADDTDATVNTWAQGVAKYGTINAFLSHLGYNPTRIIYVSTSGSNSTGVIGDMSHPFASWSGIALKPGDMVIYRGGTYGAFNDNSVDGTASNPIVFMAMPGEKVVFSASSIAMAVDGSNVVFDGFVASDPTKSGTGSGLENHYGHNMTFRNIEAVGFKWGFHAVQDLQNILVEYSVFHDNPGEHGLYFGSRDLPSANITIRDSLFYRNGRTGIQYNGRVSNLLIEGNVIHTNNLAGISFLEGVHDSIVRGNLIFNNNKQGIVVNTYDDAASTILPYNQYNLTFEDNIIWVGRYSWNGNYQPANFQGILFNDTTSAQKYEIYGCVIRNNTIVTYSGPAIDFDSTRATNNTVYGNTVYRMSGSSGAFRIAGTSYSLSGFEAYSSKYYGNTYADPNFVDVSVDYYLTPDKFDFHTK